MSKGFFHGAMRTHFHGVAVDVARAEASRFRHPLLLLHGLWTGSAIWRGFMGYLAHRGWNSWAPSFLEADHPIADRGPMLVDLCRTLPAPPVVLGHDAGAHLATELASTLDLPAVVAVTPLLSRHDVGRAGVFAWSRLWRARLSATLPPPVGAAAPAYRAAGDVLRPDSAAFFRRIAAASLPRANRPCLLVGSPGDRITDAAEAERVARERGWTFHRHAGRGHFPMVEPGWERLADDVHRWLVQTLGEALLLFLEDRE